MKCYSFMPAQSHPASLISSSEHTEQRGGHRDYKRDHRDWRGSHSYLQIRRWHGQGAHHVGKLGKISGGKGDQAMTRLGKGRPERVKLYDGNHGKLSKIGEGHDIFGWPLWLRHVRSIIPGEHDADSYSC